MLTERTRGIAVHRCRSVVVAPCNRPGASTAVPALRSGRARCRRSEGSFRLADSKTRTEDGKARTRRGGSVAETVKKGARITGADRAKLAGELTKKYSNG